ncbi:MAG: cytochrome c biogenesis protein CcdA [Candidatus Coatesbacteria bacterium]|nr:cytochrome c biogenesis protein CcdA [Candidatus Coatesbacteria bacterium]
MQGMTWAVAFLAGLASFISPCILPIVPSYLAFITGLSLSDLTAEKKSAKIRKTTVISTLCFIMGFSVVFVSLGAGASKIGLLLQQHMEIISKVAGVIVVIFGLFIMGVLKLNFLSKHKQLEVKSKPAGYIGSFFIGIAFSLGWTPCVGPILGAILLVASQSDTVWAGIYLLCFYSLGMAVPFFLTSIAVDSALGYFTKLKKHMRKINIAAGILLILVGIMIFTGSLSSIINEYFAPDLGDDEDWEFDEPLVLDEAEEAEALDEEPAIWATDATLEATEATSAY